MSETATEHGEHVRDMFARIAQHYDSLNHLLSANFDKRWRKKVAGVMAAHLQTAFNTESKAPHPSTLLLDVACGTGDLTKDLAEATEADVIGLDFCRPMLEIAAHKTSLSTSHSRSDRHIKLYIEADALRLPFADRVFEGVTIAFGLRNLASYQDGLREVLRVLRPGGMLAVLECSKPVIPAFRTVYSFYLNSLLPLIGGQISGSSSAYRYLPDSIKRFPDQQHLAEMMRETGFMRVTHSNFFAGIVALHIGYAGYADYAPESHETLLY